MPHLSKAVATAVAAALLAACPVVATAADAHPARTHTHTHRHTHAAHDKLTGPRRGASHAIGAQLKAVKALANRAAALTITDAGRLQDALADDAAAVQGDLDAVGDAGSVRALHTLLMAANTSRQVARLQFEVVVAADAAKADADALGATIESLFGPVVDSDVAADVAALDAAATAEDTIWHRADGAVAFVLDDLSPTPTRADLHAAIEDSEAALQSISDDLAALAATVAAIQANYSV